MRTCNMTGNVGVT